MEMQTQLSDEAETQESKLSFASLYTHRIIWTANTWVKQMAFRGSYNHLLR